MKPRDVVKGVSYVGAVDWDRRLFDSLVPIPNGTSYNSFLISGSEKTALVDTVDPTHCHVLIEYLKDVPSIDYIISHHAEQDHSGSIPVVLAKYPNAKVLTTQKGKGILASHLGIPEDKMTAMEDGATISLGGKTIEFMHTQWVHWPETMSTYLVEDKILFSCDLFGSHLAVSGLYETDSSKVLDAAKRYFAEVMMPFRTHIKKHIERFESRDIALIAPSHGPLHRNAADIMNAHKDWVSDKLSNTVVIPFTSMHGSTQAMADYLTESLSKKNIQVERYNLSVTDTGRFIISLVDAATMVIGSPAILTGAHPQVIAAAYLANALKPRLKYASVIGSFAWGSKTVEDIKAVMTGLKVEWLNPVMIKGALSEDGKIELDRLAGEIHDRHKQAGIA